MVTLNLKNNYKTELIDITEMVKEQVMKAGVRNGLCTIFSPHTTASVVLFEKSDPKLRRDFLSSLSRIAPMDMNYESDGDNAPAHIKSTLCGARVVVPVKDGAMMIGEWQGIFFCEFDGPREREVIVQVI
jgi:secondary thiamine-phosphate synthase enzyme